MAFLVSPGAKWMTGSTLRMDGGEVKIDLTTATYEDAPPPSYARVAPYPAKLIRQAPE